jgi:hypothetical protein
MPSNTRTTVRGIGQGFVFVCVLAASLSSAWNGAGELTRVQELGPRLVAFFNVVLGVLGGVALWGFVRRYAWSLVALGVWGMLGVVTAGTAAGLFAPPEDRTAALVGSIAGSAILMGVLWFVAFQIIRGRSSE